MRLETIQCELLPYIQNPPYTLRDMYSNACSSDQKTIEVWREKWLTNIKANKERYGSFAENSIGQLFGAYAGLPVILAGSGPSLARNIGKLKDRPKHMKLVSCLHNFHAMEDAQADVDLYVSLDAGPVTIEEVSEGGNPETDYFAKTEGKTLLCYIGTHPDLLEKWRGKVLFYNAPVPDSSFRQEIDEIEPFHTWVSNGGNVLGACMYISKGFLGAGPAIFIGSDFSFSNGPKTTFHAWDSKYDKDIGQFVRVNDIHGNSIKTWGSYWNFKLWFDYVTMVLPGIWINATEGGIFGAYPTGNIMSLIQLELDKVYSMFSLHEQLRFQAENPSLNERGNQVILV